MKRDIAVLFVRSDSIYLRLGIDCYDKERNALSYTGKKAVICHPPCRTWGRLRGLAKGSEEEHKLAIWSIEMIRKNGGVLEHPAGSKLWEVMKLPRGQETDEFGGFTVSIDQSWFGHKARKKTWLYICGIEKRDIPEWSISYNAIEHTISQHEPKSKTLYKLKEISKADRERTPERLAKWLIEIAENCVPG